MSGFQQTITHREIAPHVTEPVVDTSTANDLNLLNKGLSMGLDVRDKMLQQELAGELGDAGADGVDVSDAKVNVARSIADTDNARTINILHKEFRKLDDMERSGKANAQAVSLRKDAKLKSYVNQYPWLANDFRTIAAGQARVAASATPEVSIEEQQLEEDIKNAMASGMTLGSYKEGQRLATEKAIQANKGSITMPEVELAAQARASLGVLGFLSELTKETTTNPDGIESVDWLTKATLVKQEVVDWVYSEKARLAEQGIRLDTKELDSLFKQIDNKFRSLDMIAKSSDKVKLAKDMLAMQEANSVRMLDNMLPGMGNLTALIGKEAVPAMLKEVPNLIRQISTGATREQLDVMLKGNPTGGIVFEALLAGKGWDGMLSTIGDGDERDRAFSLLKKRISAGIISNPEIEPGTELNNNAHREVLNSANPMELGNYLDNGVFSQTIKDPKVVGELKERVVNNTVQVVNGFLQDKATTRSVDTSIEEMGMGVIGVELPADINEYDLQYVDGEFSTTKAILNSSLVEQLNLFHKLNRKFNFFDTTEQSWIDEILNKVNASTFLEDPTLNTVPVEDVEELPEKDQRTKLIDAGFSEEDADAAIKHLKGETSPDISKLDPGTYMIDGELVEIA